MSARVKRKRPTVISLFSGAMGLDLGMEAAGFDIRVAVECNAWALATIRANRPALPVIEKRVEVVPTSEILARAGLRVGEATVVTGGPSCQSFSTAGLRGSVADPRGAMFHQFLRVVSEARPRFFVMENVRGMLSAAVKHRPLSQRGPGFPLLEADEELGSAFNVILRDLKALGYHVVFDVVNAADYGAPQARERILFLGSRDGEPIQIAPRTHSVGGKDGKRPWVTLRDALSGLKDSKPEFPALTPTMKRFLALVPEGGNWRDLPDDIQAEALGGAFVSWGGRCGFYRRLAWDQPTPALTTKPDGRATMFCHPTELRPLSVREYARIQQFPDDWSFAGTIGTKYKQIGNAVPLALGRSAGLAVQAAMKSRPQLHRLGAIVCRDLLLRRISTRARTILNPVRMRTTENVQASKTWLLESRNRPRPIGDHVTTAEQLNVVPSGSNSRTRMKAHRATLELHALYGSPDHGNKPDPLDELFFILLSQMTTHQSFNRVYDRLREVAPTWANVAALPLRKLRTLIKDAGLSGQRAPRIKAILARIRKDFGEYSLASLVPLSDQEAEKYLASLPGVGTKTAKCVLMYSLRRHVLPVDTHVWRVGCRLGLVDQTIGRERGQVLLEAAVPPTDRYSFHVNALAFGRDICIASQPRCEVCPLRNLCNHGRGRALSATHAT